MCEVAACFVPLVWIYYLAVFLALIKSLWHGADRACGTPVQPAESGRLPRLVPAAESAVPQWNKSGHMPFTEPVQPTGRAELHPSELVQPVPVRVYLPFSSLMIPSVSAEEA